MKEQIRIWKEQGVAKAVFNYDCGNDSFNYYSTTFLDKNGKDITEQCEEIHGDIETSVFNNYTFYDASNGHYIGEGGDVFVTLNEDGDDFSYNKVFKTQWNESLTGVDYLELDDETLSLIADKIANINGGNDGDEGNIAVNYKRDCILSDRELELIKTLKKSIYEIASEFEDYSDATGEVDYEWFTFNTAKARSELSLEIIEENKLKIYVSTTETVLKDGD